MADDSVLKPENIHIPATIQYPNRTVFEDVRDAIHRLSLRGLVTAVPTPGTSSGGSVSSGDTLSREQVQAMIDLAIADLNTDSDIPTPSAVPWETPVLFEDFMSGAPAFEFVNLYGGGSWSIVASEVDHPGIIRFTMPTAGGAGNRWFIKSNAIYNPANVRSIFCAFRYHLTSGTDVSVALALGDDPYVASGDAVELFGYTAGTNKFTGLVLEAGVTTHSQASTIDMAADTWFLLEIRFGDGIATFIVNGVKFVEFDISNIASTVEYKLMLIGASFASGYIDVDFLGMISPLIQQRFT